LALGQGQGLGLGPRTGSKDRDRVQGQGPRTGSKDRVQGQGPRTGPRLIKKYKIILKLEKLTSGYKDTFFILKKVYEFYRALDLEQGLGLGTGTWPWDRKGQF
jgi:hypothetical protein